MSTRRFGRSPRAPREAYRWMGKSEQARLPRCEVHPRIPPRWRPCGPRRSWRSRRTLIHAPPVPVKLPWKASCRSALLALNPSRSRRPTGPQPQQRRPMVAGHVCRQSHEYLRTAIAVSRHRFLLTSTGLLGRLPARRSTYSALNSSASSLSACMKRRSQ